MIKIKIKIEIKLRHLIPATQDNLRLLGESVVGQLAQPYASPRFQTLMGQLQRVASASGEGEHLLRLFNSAAVTVRDEKLQDLRSCLEMTRTGNKHISYLFEA